jgi:hypothetical protein
MSVSKSLIFSIVLAILSFLIYVTTISPTVNFIDSGELITVCHTLGIAHPTGYPLYTIIGRILSLIPVQTAACRINLLSAVLGAGAVFFVSLTTMALLRDKSHLLRCAAAILSAAFLALSRTTWDVSTQAEVYALTVFLYSALIYMALEGWRRGGPGIFLLTAYLYGLSFGNHMMVVLLFPSLLFAAVRCRANFPWKRPAFLLATVLLFTLGLSVYVYLPVRSSLEPVLNWGRPVNIERFIAHVSGWQYRVWMFAEGAEVFFSRLITYWSRITGEFTTAGAVCAVIGLVGMLNRQRDEFMFLMITFAAGLFYAVNYDIPDIDPYYLPTYVCLSLMAGVGIVRFLDIPQPLRELPPGRQEPEPLRLPLWPQHAERDGKGILCPH